jgi:hypothetical protein
MLRFVSVKNWLNVRIAKVRGVVTKKKGVERNPPYYKLLIINFVKQFLQLTFLLIRHYYNPLVLLFYQNMMFHTQMNL